VQPLTWNPDPDMIFFLDKTTHTTTSGTIWAVSGTITDQDTWIKPITNGYDYPILPDTSTKWTVHTLSGALYNNGPLNPQFATIGSGSIRTTFTYQAKEVSAQTIFQDTYIPSDTDAVTHLVLGSWRSNLDTNGSVQVVTVTVNPS
jgi:hypothetical protein